MCFSSFFLFSSLSCLSFSCFPEVSDFLSFLSSQLSLSSLLFHFFPFLRTREREEKRERENGGNQYRSHTYIRTLYLSFTRTCIYIFFETFFLGDPSLVLEKKKERDFISTRREKKR